MICSGNCGAVLSIEEMGRGKCSECQKLPEQPKRRKSDKENKGRCYLQSLPFTYRTT